ncbi:hypothetical protein GCM10009557_05790 [Virgisporangium ochraceum]|uniref:Uncharacterized protein n=1 Tax=Virgisporangium ochraceum TaxID=65505 RepID=A0A8J4E8Z9_9ACTN|nr:hypothetical protein [Virgisporangium ochraceum]GIJ66236.1 hypothetical protein Voc01_011530 [Virgisporangium ochraceum]
MSEATLAARARALADLRAARQRYVDAQVPMENPDGSSPRWTSDQHMAVLGYVRAWDTFWRAHQSHSEMPS